MSSFAHVRSDNYPAGASARWPYGQTQPQPATGIGLKVGVFFALHIPLALLMQQLPYVGLVHALIVLVGGLWWIAGARRPERAAYVCAYIVGSEVLWRMTKTPVFWEFGKYAGTLVLFYALVRHGRFKFPLLPIFYFALLLPSIITDFSTLSFEDSRQQVSFNLSGPLAIMVSALYFAQLKLSGEQLHRVLLVALVPVGGVVTIVLFNVLTRSSIVFLNASNYTTSGGFGPNQVSAVLGLSALVTYFYMLGGRASVGFKAFLLGLGLLFVTLSALTFSRYGLLAFGVSVLLSGVFFFRDTRARLKFIFILFFLLASVYFVILPRLSSFTGGAIVSRFEGRSSTGRDVMMLTDLKIWWDNPFFGVGLGMTRPYYAAVLNVGPDTPAHTEFTRMLAEHGLFGLASMILLLFMALEGARRAKEPRIRAVMIGLLTWSLLYMLGNAMRLLAPAFLFGLTFCRIAYRPTDPPRKLLQRQRRHLE